MKLETTPSLPPGLNAEKLVYVKPIADDELSQIVPAEMMDQLDAHDQIFAIHDASGTRMALIEGRDAAFAAARAYELQPSSVH